MLQGCERLQVVFPGDPSKERAVVEISYKGGAFFDEEKGTNIYSFARFATQHGIAGRNYGNFLGCFARLLRHARGLAVDSATAGGGSEWMLVEPNRSAVLIGIERADHERYFWIEDSFEKGKGCGRLRLTWDRCGWNTKIEARSMSNPQQEGVDSSGVDKSGAPQLNPPADAVQCFVLDHSEDGPWAKALNALGEMGGRLGNLKIVGVSQGLDSPDRLLIPNDTKVIILHTRQNMIVWQKAFGTKYGIVRAPRTYSARA